MKAIKNAKLILEEGIIWDGVLLYDGDKIVDLGWARDVVIPAGAEIIDAQGLYAAPGLIDIHNHGSQFVLFHNDPMAASEHFLRHGQTTVLPTFYCDLTAEQIVEGAKKVREASKTGAGRILDGLYMEGPYMNGEGSNQKFIKWNGGINAEDYVPMVEEVKDLVRVWAVDTDREGIESFIQYARKANPDVVFAYGHSDASLESCQRLRHYGFRVQTHWGDSGHSEGKAQGTYGAGVDENSLYDRDLYAELICDERGIHVTPGMLKMLLRVKDREKIILITDSMTASGDYKNNEAEGVAFGPDLNYDYEGHLSGSHLTLDCAVRNVMTHTDCGLCQAIRMASLNPAQMLGIDDRVGSLKAGKTANIILMDDMVNVKSVILQGERMV